MIKKIKSIYRTHIFLFLISIVLISFLGLFYYSRYGAKQMVLSEFRHELEMTRADIEFAIEINREHLKALSSRTMIKKELNKWEKREIPFDSLVSFTSPKYIEGVLVYHNLSFAGRYDSSGREIVSFNKRKFPGKITSIDRERIFRNQDNYYIIIKNCIVENGNVIGCDIGEFLLFNPSEYDFRYLENIKIISDNEINRSDLPSDVSVLTIDDSGYSLFAELSGKEIEHEYRKFRTFFLIHSLIVIGILFLISYFTILRSSHKLFKNFEKVNRSLIVRERFAAFGQISAGITHDFNNFLTGIMGNTELLLSSGIEDPSQRNLIELILDDCNKAKKKIQSLSEFNYLDYVKMKTVDFVVFLDEIKKDSEFPHGMALVGRNLPEKCMVPFDREMIRTAFLRLFEFSLSLGSVAVEYEISRIVFSKEDSCPTCQIERSGEWVVISFRDNGKTIDKITAEHIFEPFYFLREKGERSDLGLSQVYGIVKQHFGHLVIKSEQDKGNRYLFYFSLDPKRPEFPL